MRTMTATEFKAKCLRVMDEVAANREPVVITKKGKPVARIVPAEKPRKSILGCMAGTARTVGDLLEPVSDPSDWELD